ncbi:MAG: Hsp70 family protein, partial [Anaerolineales bacterium]|nr:Hsp70 family protein [Anaerolineales bacterium]
SLGRFILDGIPPAPRGVPQIEVTFDINADGILHVSAKDKATSREQSMQIVASSGLSDSEIDRMTSDAEAHAAEDARFKEQVEARNVADSAVYTAEKFVRENGEQLPEANKQAINSQVEKVKELLNGDDVDALKAANDELQAVLQQAGATMYEQGQAAGGAAPGADSGQEDDDVIEGEFSEA